ncbi:MAG TPA: hypothetical protein VI357_09040 [Mycobacteriales bacterium]
MADVLTSGSGDARPPWPRHRRAAVAAAVLATAGLGYVAVQPGGSGPPTRDEPLPTVEVRPPPYPARTGAPARAAVFRLDGVRGPGPAGQRLLVGGLDPAVLDLGAGRLTPLPIRMRADEVAELDRGPGITTAVLRNSAGRWPRGVVLGPDRRPVPLGPLIDLVPLRDGGVLTEDCAGPAGTGPCTLFGRTATGAARWSRTVPRRIDLVRDTPYGLLVRAYQGDQGGVARLEDPSTGGNPRVVGRTYEVLGADDRHVVFLPPGCAGECGLTLADLATGAARALPSSPGNPAAVAFSTDGRRLAVGYAGLLPDDPSASPRREGSVLVVDLAGSGRARTLPGLSTGSASTALPVWTRDGRLLLVVPADGHGTGRVALWTPGAAGLRLLPVTLTGFYGTPGQAVLLT